MLYESTEAMAGILYVVKMEEGKVSKPVTEVQVLSLIKSGRLLPEQLVRRSEGKTWQPIHVMFGLRDPNENDSADTDYAEEEEEAVYTTAAVASPSPVESPMKRPASGKSMSTTDDDLDLSKHPAILHFARVLRIVGRVWRVIALLSLCFFGLAVIFSFINQNVDSLLLPAITMIPTAFIAHWTCVFWSDVIRYLAALSVRWVKETEHSGT